MLDLEEGEAEAKPPPVPPPTVIVADSPEAAARMIMDDLFAPLSRARARSEAA